MEWEEECGPAHLAVGPGGADGTGCFTGGRAVLLWLLLKQKKSASEQGTCVLRSHSNPTEGTT